MADFKLFNDAVKIIYKEFAWFSIKAFLFNKNFYMIGKELKERITILTAL